MRIVVWFVVVGEAAMDDSFVAIFSAVSTLGVFSSRRSFGGRVEWTMKEE